eukprot:g1380.t1
MDAVETLRIKKITGKHEFVECRTTDTIYKLKQKICESEGIQTEQIRLVVKGKQLKDQVTLKAAKLKNNSVVTMILSL